MSGHPAEDAVGPRRGNGELHVVRTLLRQAFENLGGIGARERGIHCLVGDGAFSRNDFCAVRRSVLIDEVDHHIRVRRQGQSSAPAGEAVEGEWSCLQLEGRCLAVRIPLQKLVLARRRTRCLSRGAGIGGGRLRGRIVGGWGSSVASGCLGGGGRGLTPRVDRGPRPTLGRWHRSHPGTLGSNSRTGVWGHGRTLGGGLVGLSGFGGRGRAHCHGVTARRPIRTRGTRHQQQACDAQQ